MMVSQRRILLTKSLFCRSLTGLKLHGKGLRLIPQWRALKNVTSNYYVKTSPDCDEE